MAMVREDDRPLTIDGHEVWVGNGVIVTECETQPKGHLLGNTYTASHVT